MHGWVGKLLRVDLTHRKVTKFSTSQYVPRLIGGWGIAAKIAWDELLPQIGAFDAENRLIIVTGPLTGTLFPGTGRTEVCTISPITYSFCGPTEDYIRSGIGGQWGPELKFAGYDGIVIQGRSDEPVWIYIEDGKVEIKDARELWGLDTYATQEAIWRKLGTKAKVLCIGPAGEKCVRFATIATDNGNQSGIGGTGAVMGAKNLKAIAVKGSGCVKMAIPEKAYELAYKMHRYRFQPEARPPFGLHGVGHHRLGQGGKGEKQLIDHLKKDTFKAVACWGCPVACRPVFSVPDGIRPGISNFCSGLSRFRGASQDFYGKYTKDYLKVVGLLDGYGINCHDIYYIIEWLQGCYRTGSLREKETGIPFKDYGSYEFFERLLRKIVWREGFGDLLAEGVHRASDALGGTGKKFIDDVNRGFHKVYHPQVYPTSAFVAAFESSQRLPMYHAWAARVVKKHGEEPGGRGWLTNDEWIGRLRELFGDRNVIDHSDEGFYHPDKAYLAKWTEDYKTAGVGCFIFCDWIIGHFWSWYSEEPNRRDPSPQNESQSFSLTTGVDMDVREMIRGGERVRNLERAIMVREGRRREHDTLADVCFKVPQDGNTKTTYSTSSLPSEKVPGRDGHWVKVSRAIDKERWENLKSAYYVERGWDVATGIPTRKKMDELDLNDIADDMESLGLLPKAQKMKPS